MTMDAAEVERLKAMMEWEGARTAPPDGFPAQPDLLFWPTSLGPARLELIAMAPDWGEGPAPDLWTLADPAAPHGRAMSRIIVEDS